MPIGSRIRYNDIPSDENMDSGNHVGDNDVYDNDGVDDDEDEDDFVASGGGLDPGRLGSANSYSSILRDEEDQQHVPRRRRAPPPHPASGNYRSRRRSGGCCTCLWMTLLVVMILGVAGIVVWRIESKLNPETDGHDANSDTNQSSSTLSSSWVDTWDRWFSPKSVTKGASTEGNPSDTEDATSTIKAIPSANQGSVHYDPDAALQYYNPFNFKQGDWYGSVALPPPQGGAGQANARLGYLSQPSMVGPHLVFVTEGDLYYTQYSSTRRTAAFKLTTTVGNIRTPTLNPDYPFFVAYTATYTGHREVYAMDMRPVKGYTQAAIRLTYWDTSHGITSIVGWKDNGKTLVFAAQSREVGLPDTRLYEISLQSDLSGPAGSQVLQVLKISPIPLSQAIDGVWNDDCVYFTRFQQSSNTIRYVGGTAESLWAWCEGESEAVPLTSDYPGASKSPKIVTGHDDGQLLLLFMSDRNVHSNVRDANGTITASSMNLFATPLPSRADLYNQEGQSYTIQEPRALTTVSCSFGGLALREYTVHDDKAVLRIGGDFHLMEPASSISHSIQTLDIVVYSDFHEHQERLLPVSVSKDMTSADVYTTAFGSTAALLGMRGQLFIAPVIPSLSSGAGNNKYAGAGMNLPPRRYRVVPGTTMGGVVRVLSASYVPMPQEVGKTTRRLALILATDPKTETAEHAFYLIETQSDSAPSFVGTDVLPEPFLGGSTSTGGSVANGGLGSVVATSVRLSPCGRRLAWTDTDGRICVMTMPMYKAKSDDTPPYTVLPTMNENEEPMVGIGVDLSWSPGGRYLAVTHSAKNQFMIISIVDCGDPNIEGTEEVADIRIGRVVQATPSRFNAESPYWGKTGMDQATAVQAATFASLLGKKAPKDAGGATVLYFLTDRDVVSDVKSPWGPRAPGPHFDKRQSVYALPLVKVKQNPMNPMAGFYAGGGAAELWADGLIDLQLQLEALEGAAPATGGADKPKERRLTRSHLLAAAVAARSVQRSVVDSSGSQTAGDFGSDNAFGGDNDFANSPQLSTPSQMFFPTGLGSSSSPSPTTGSSQSPLAPFSSTDAPTPPFETFSPSSAPTYTTTGFPSTVPSTAPSQAELSPVFPNDNEIDFGSIVGLVFARKAYRIAGIPAAPYKSILCQLQDDPSLILVESTQTGATVKLMATEDFPSDKIEVMPLYQESDYLGSGLSTTRDHIMFVLAPGRVKVVANTVTSVLQITTDSKMEQNIVDTAGMAVSVWPSLEYRQMFNDAWRMMRDYFYDTNMHGVDWVQMHERYSSLASRCSKREELDDVLAQMSSELSALHVFVYGGEYNDPMHGNADLTKLHEVASLGGNFERSLEYNGFIVTSIAHRDPDFNLVDGSAIYSPLSSQVLELSGQQGLDVGDVIVGINGESVMRVPDMHMLLRGTAGRSVRLDVLRQPQIPRPEANETDLKPQPVITVPLSQADADNLRYAAWEWKTLQLAKKLAQGKRFTVGYVHLRSMLGPEDIDAFTRGFFTDYDKQALIIDVRHNNGGNIDSWLLDVLQRRAWMYWQGRATNVNNGGLGWDQQFAFRGHVVVLIDEKSSSDAEGFARGVSELGLGKLVGTRTWGGGIWLASDNRLVDGGIASAPEVGTYSFNFGWGLGIEQQGVSPDVHIDNNPRLAFEGKDPQLEKAIDVLAEWLLEEPVVLPSDPGAKPDKSLHAIVEQCRVR